MQQALWLSLKAGALATLVALVLGSAAAFGVHRFRFFGRDAVSFLLVLPIALPGIITGHGAQLVLHLLEAQLRPLDDRDRPRHLLRRGRLQQRDRAAAARARLARSRRRWISAPTACRRSAT